MASYVPSIFHMSFTFSPGVKVSTLKVVIFAEDDTVLLPGVVIPPVVQPVIRVIRKSMVIKN